MHWFTDLVMAVTLATSDVKPPSIHHITVDITLSGTFPKASRTVEKRADVDCAPASEATETATATTDDEMPLVHIKDIIVLLNYEEEVFEEDYAGMVLSTAVQCRTTAVIIPTSQ